MQVEDSAGDGGPRRKLDRRDVAWHRRDPGADQLVGLGRLGLEILDMFSQQLGQKHLLAVVEWPGQNLLAKRIESGLQPRGILSQRALGQRAGGLDLTGVVEHHEGGERGVGAGPLGGAFLAGRGVERQQGRVEELPLPVRVQPPAILRGTGVMFVGALGEMQVGPVAGRLVRLDAAAANLLEKQPADGERVVADQLGVQPESGLPCDRSSRTP